jgi:hypothetical protein
MSKILSPSNATAIMTASYPVAHLTSRVINTFCKKLLLAFVSHSQCRYSAISPPPHAKCHSRLKSPIPELFDYYRDYFDAGVNIRAIFSLVLNS